MIFNKPTIQNSIRKIIVTNQYLLICMLVRTLFNILNRQNNSFIKKKRKACEL